MKMVKKFMFGLVAAATILSLVSCDGLLKKDDDKGAITGSGKNYKVEYNNEDAEAYRAYKATTLKHAGGLVKVTFDSANVSTSKMGIIFDLKANAADKNARDFYAIGLNPKGKNSGTANFYVSKFTNVTDMQAYNFGTDLTENPAKEVEIVKLATTNNIAMPAADAEGKVSVYVYYKTLLDGSFDYKILNISDEIAKAFKFDTGAFESSAILAQGNTKAKAGAEYAPTSEDDLKTMQGKLAFYAQVAANTELNGSWKVIGTYLEAEDAE